jgi:hypothetical protein
VRGKSIALFLEVGRGENVTKQKMKTMFDQQQERKQEK